VPAIAVTCELSKSSKISQLWTLDLIDPNQASCQQSVSPGFSAWINKDPSKTFRIFQHLSGVVTVTRTQTAIQAAIQTIHLPCSPNFFP
jgi:hypothetical protein